MAIGPAVVRSRVWTTQASGLDRRREEQVSLYPQDTFAIATSLPKAEVVNKLQDLVAKSTSFFDTSIPFEGNVCEDGFTIRRSVNCQNRLSPVSIHGKIDEAHGATIIHVTIKTARSTVIFAIMWLGSIIGTLLRILVSWISDPGLVSKSSLTTVLLGAGFLGLLSFGLVRHYLDRFGEEVHETRSTLQRAFPD